MADFLTNLAARTLGVLPTVQPALGSLFAASVNLSGSTLAGNEDDREASLVDDKTALTTPPVPQRPAPAVRPPTSPVADLASSLPTLELPDAERNQPVQRLAVETTSSRSTPHRPMPRDNQPLLLNERQPQQVQLVPAATPVAPPRDQPQATVPQVAGQTAVVPESSLGRPAATPPLPLEMSAATYRSVDTILLPAPASQRVRREDDAEQPGLLVPLNTAAASSATKPMVRSAAYASPVDPALASFEPTRLPDRVAREMTQGERTRLSTPARQAEPPALVTPTIQVTIGRIEVRATPPPPSAPARKAQATPALSLEDYLRNRNGGKR